MSAEEIKAISRQYVEEVQSGHSIDAMDKFISVDIVDHTGTPSSVQGIERSKQFFTGLFKAFPDLRAEIHEQIATRFGRIKPCTVLTWVTSLELPLQVRVFHTML